MKKIFLGVYLTQTQKKKVEAIQKKIGGGASKSQVIRSLIENARV